jgi:hypothetical protein
VVLVPPFGTKFTPTVAELNTEVGEEASHRWDLCAEVEQHGEATSATPCRLTRPCRHLRFGLCSVELSSCTSKSGPLTNGRAWDAEQVLGAQRSRRRRGALGARATFADIDFFGSGDRQRRRGWLMSLTLWIRQDDVG